MAQKPKNNLNSPLFCIAAHKGHVLIAGGGGGK
jgi:carbamate kinase